MSWEEEDWRDEIAELRGAADAALTAWTLAVSALALPARLPLAGAGTLAQALVRVGAAAFDGVSAGAPSTPAHRLIAS
jgi:hypothetical protein